MTAAIFFDIDETLLDHRHAEEAGAAAFQKRHAEFLEIPDFVALWHELSESFMNRYLRGEFTHQGQRRARLREIYRRLGREIADDEADERFASYLRAYEENWRAFPDVGPCLDSLRDLPLGVISNGDPALQKRKLKRLGLRDRFVTIVISGELGVAKPAPEIFLEACRRIGSNPGDCVFVGDNLDVDARGSLRAGMQGIWLNRRSGEAMEDVETIGSLDELCGFA